MRRPATRRNDRHTTKAGASLFLSFALSRAQGIVGIHVRHIGTQFSQANDEVLSLLRRKTGQQSVFPRKRRDNDAVVKRIAGFGQPHNSRTIVLGVRFARDEPLLLENMQASADCAFIESDGVDDLVGADIRHARENPHHAPFGDAKAEMLPVGVGCATRQSVRNVGEKIRNVTVEIERCPTGRRDSPLTNVFLLHKMPRNCSTEIRPFAKDRTHR